MTLPFDPIDEAARQWGLRWDGVPAMHAVTSLMRVQQLVLARLDAILKPHGLTFARYEALVLLIFSSRGLAAAGQDGGAAAGAPHLGHLDHRTGSRRAGLSYGGSTPTTAAPCWPRSPRPAGPLVEAATADLVAAGFALDALSEDQLRQLSELLARSATRQVTSERRRTGRLSGCGAPRRGRCR